MLYLIYGSDRQKVINGVSAIVEGLKKRKPDAEVFTVTDDNLDLSKIKEFAGGQGLFESKFIVVLKNIFSKKDAVGDVLKLLPSLGVSQNVFIFSEASLTKPVLEAFKKAGGKVEDLSPARPPWQTGGAPKPVFNIFSLADALGERNRKTLWVLFQQALRHAVSAEELSGVFFWQIKNMILAREAKNAGDVGVSPYVFQKSKRYNKNFSPDEETRLASKILSLYHDAHRGLVDFDIGLELFILSL